jgi:fused signal recognition particle receptor
MWTKAAQRVKQALGQSAQKLRHLFSGLGACTNLDIEQAGQLEEALILADFGPSLAKKIVKDLTSQPNPSRAALAQRLESYLSALLQPYQATLDPCPLLIMVGVNGSGKTTVLGKLAQLWHNQGHPICLVAGDTFRAAASEQLAAWGGSFAHIFSDPGKDPASLAFQGATYGQHHPGTCVLMDTAGRLPNKPDLMDQLRKVVTVAGKAWPQVSPKVILVVDAGSGQHGLTQCDAFSKAVPLAGIIVTKMDSTAKGGILAALALHTNLPILALGVGEGPQDLEPFQAETFVQGLLQNAF